MAMFIVVRKFYGVVARVWLGWVAAYTLFFALCMRAGLSHYPQFSTPEASFTEPLAEIAAGMFLVSLFTASAGLPPSVFWTMPELLQKPVQPKTDYVRVRPEQLKPQRKPPVAEPKPDDESERRATNDRGRMFKGL